MARTRAGHSTNGRAPSAPPFHSAVMIAGLVPSSLCCAAGLDINARTPYPHPKLAVTVSTSGMSADICGLGVLIDAYSKRRGRWRSWTETHNYRAARRSGVPQNLTMRTVQGEAPFCFKALEIHVKI